MNFNTFEVNKPMHRFFLNNWSENVYDCIIWVMTEIAILSEVLVFWKYIMEYYF